MNGCGKDMGRKTCYAVFAVEVVVLTVEVEESINDF